MFQIITIQIITIQIIITACFFRVHKVAHSCYLGLWLILVAVRLILQRVDNFTFNQSADFTRTLKVAELKVFHKTAFSLFDSEEMTETAPPQ